MDQLNGAVIPSGPSIYQLPSYINETASRPRHDGTLDAEIIPSCTTLAIPQESRKQLQTIQDELFTPICRLPVEVLGAIFAQVCFGTVISLERGNKSEILCLSQVCHQWREIIGGTPRLWTSGTWDIDLRNHKRFSVPMVSHYLSMSQDTPLNLELYACWVRTNSTHEEVLRMLLGQSDRWRSAELTLNEYVWECVMEELETRGPRPVNGYFPNLELLTIDDGMLDPLDFEFMAPVPAFEIAPKLSSLTIYNFTDSFVLPYAQLKSLQLRNYADDSALDDKMRFLHQCRGLEKLEFRLDSFLQDTRSLLILPNYTSLSTLTLRSESPYLFSRAFRTLTFPSLKELIIYCIGFDPHPWPTEEFQSMISRSGCALEVLEINGPFLATESSLHETFRVVPTLFELRISWKEDVLPGEPITSTGKAYSTALLDSLTIKSTVQSQHQVVLPRLSYLVMINIPLDTELADKCVNMVDSRKRLDIPGAACLENLEFVGLNSVTGFELDCLEIYTIQNFLDRLNPRLTSSGVRDIEGEGSEFYRSELYTLLRL